MQISITARHYTVSNSVRTYLDARMNRLERFSDKIQSAQITLTSEKNRNSAEIVLRVDGKDFTGKDESTDMFSAVDGVSEKIEHQLRRFKDRRTTSRKNGPKHNGDQLSGTLRILKGDSVGREAEDHEVLKVEEYPIPSMTVDEAILKLEQVEEEFVVFANTSTELIHVVYKASDGHYGVLNLHATR